MEPLPVRPWAPGQPVEGTSSIKDICTAFAFGLGDDSFTTIGEKLIKCNYITVDQLADGCTTSEFCAMARACVPAIKKKARFYQDTIESAMKRKLELGHGIKTEGDENVKKQCGGDYSSRSWKVECTKDFKVSKYAPDARVYTDVLHEGEYISDESEKLYLDKLWLYLHADPEPSVGDYLPSCMDHRLARLHKDLELPLFKPKHFGKVNQEERTVRKTIYNRFFNGRFVTYKRVVLDEAYRSHFSEKVQKLICFVDSGSVECKESERNAAYALYLDIFAGKTPKMELVFPKEKQQSPEEPKQQSPEEAAAAWCEEAADDPAPPPPPAKRAEDSSDDEGDLSALDGATLSVPDRLWVKPPEPPKGKKKQPLAPKDPNADSKKGALKKKRAAAAEARRTAQPKQQKTGSTKKRAAEKADDSGSDDEDSDDESEDLDSSEG